MRQIVKAEGETYSRVWESLTKHRQATFFSNDLDVKVGDTLEFWRRRDGIKETISARVVSAMTAAGRLKRFSVEEIPDGDDK